MTATISPDTLASSSVVQVLDRYLSETEELRELVRLRGARGSRLVVDRRASDQSDPRLLAHLSSDEPFANALTVAALYVADARRSARALREADLRRLPLSERAPHASCAAPEQHLTDRDGIRYRLAPISADATPPRELRWLCEPAAGITGRVECVSARRVVGAVEAYEPIRAMTIAALADHRRDGACSVATLALELRRLEASPIVLNRGLREAVLDAITRRGLTLSAIALACGRVKRDRRGRRSGETSWLGRRIGLLPEAAGMRPNPWVHSDVLGLIARNGLGIAPHEVELG